MAYFTMAVKDVLALQEDNGFGYKLGLDAYPLFDNAYRNSLNRKIIEHFWNREIGQETISMWTFAMRRKMNEIMPLYNQVYLSTKIQFDPLATFNLETVMEDTGSETASMNGSTKGSGSETSGQTANSASTANANSGSRQTNLDTPQMELNGKSDYASSGAVNKASSNSNNSSKTSNTGTAKSENASTNTESSTSATEGNRNSTTKGFQGSAADLLTKYRATLLNVDMLVIDELERGGLFMQIWNNAEEILSNRHAIGWY